jgi:hypothetical protein
VNRFRMRLFAGAVLSFAGVTSAGAAANAQVANNQTDGRDYEALAYLPKDTLVTLGYFREQSTSDNTSFSQSLGIFRASYILKYGNLAIVPFDALLPVVDATVYAPVPMSPGLTTTLHTSGVGDPTYLPTIGYIIPEDEAGTHTYVAATAYVTAPLGNYDSARLVNIGDNRWRIQPQIAVGQRFLKAITFDLIGNVAFYTDNSKFGTGAAVVTMKQDPTLGMEAHLFGDLTPTFTLGASYYLAAVGQRSITAPGLPQTTIDPTQTTQTLRFTFGIHVEKNTGVFLQYDQDIEASNGAPIERFIGARITHAMFF